MIDSGITCMVKVNSSFWKWTFLFTNDNFQTERLSEELWQKSIFVFLGQGVINSSSELRTSSSPQPSYCIPPAHPYNIGHTSCSPSIAFGNRNATISSITTSHSENVSKFWYFFPQRIHIPLSKGSLVLYFTSVVQTSYHLTNKPCGVLILPLFSHQCSTPWIFKGAIRTVETLRSPIRASCTERLARTNCGNSFSQLHCTYGWVCFNIKVCWGWFPSLPIFPPEITVYVPFSKRFYDLF